MSAPVPRLTMSWLRLTSACRRWFSLPRRSSWRAFSMPMTKRPAMAESNWKSSSDSAVLSAGFQINESDDFFHGDHCIARCPVYARVRWSTAALTVVVLNDSRHRAGRLFLRWRGAQFAGVWGRHDLCPGPLQSRHHERISGDPFGQDDRARSAWNGRQRSWPAVAGRGGLSRKEPRLPEIC